MGVVVGSSAAVIHILQLKGAILYDLNFDH